MARCKAVFVVLGGIQAAGVAWLLVRVWRAIAADRRRLDDMETALAVITPPVAPPGPGLRRVA